ncbi:carboxymuconolactone decarboxylase family protein [Nocardioides sp. CPCC 205120]|uniref:carboxymuconolactone decarboxylase family protein n=1 Tax=Nocardioides sp. CPCC 205120 TaxID=3406462 RepID=UPI003B505E8D
MSGAPRIPLPSDPRVPKYGTPVDHAVAAFAGTAMRQRALDPVLTELVRLRCARVHDCRLCRSVRDVAAADELDEATAAKVDHHAASDLPPRAKAALMLADAVILDPASAGPELRAAVRRHLSEAEIAEVLLDVVKWSQQKASVALRIEVPPREGLSELRFDEAGDAAVGGALT